MAYITFMKHALELAEKGRGKVNPNPMVGCVIVLNGEIIGEGYHKEYGAPHAEVKAVNDAIEKGYKNLLRQSSIYITLEPCCHFGKTPPCVDLIIKHQFQQVIIAMEDPNPLVKGKSVAKIRSYNIPIEVGVLREEATRLNKFFIHYMKYKRPYVILKSAMTLDGKIATSTGDSKWITCKESRTYVHSLRNNVMGILTSSSTVLKDNPSLNVRHVKVVKNPIPILLDRTQKLSCDLQVFSKHENVIVFTSKDSQQGCVYPANVSVRKIHETKCGLSVKEILDDLGNMSIDSILVEVGGNLAWSFIKEALVDEFNIFIAPKILGGKASLSPVDGEGFPSINKSLELSNLEVKNIGKDLLIKAWR